MSAATTEEPEPVIVTGRLDHGDADRILRLLTPAHGRVSVMARNARKPGSPWAHLDLGVGARVRWTGRGELPRLAFTEVVEPRGRLRESYERLSLAAYALELVGAFAREGQPEPRLYGMLEMALLLLDEAEGTIDADFVLALEAKVLTFAGVAPRLGGCGGCAESLEGALCFAPDGGVFHARCAPDQVGLAPVTVELLGRIERLRRTPLKETIRAGEGTPPAAGSDLLYRSVVAHLGHPLRAREGIG